MLERNGLPWAQLRTVEAWYYAVRANVTAIQLLNKTSSLALNSV